MTETASSLDPNRITSLRVMPPLGLARLGNCTSQDNFAEDYLITTEVVGGLPIRPDGAPAQSLEDYRGPDFAIRRHAARFRLYATLDDGTVSEITLGAGVEIEWRVALANLKGGWYQFLQAMDLPSGIAKPAPRRNPNVSAASGKRPDLDIRPQPVTISGASRKGAQFQFDDGMFRGQAVYLGELRTDADGRFSCWAVAASPPAIRRTRRLPPSPTMTIGTTRSPTVPFGLQSGSPTAPRSTRSLAMSR